MSQQLLTCISTPKAIIGRHIFQCPKNVSQKNVDGVRDIHVRMPKSFQS